VTTEMCHGWMFDPDGDLAAADSTRSSTSLGTGWSVNPRTARRLVTASYTSMIAYLLSVAFLTVSFNTISFDIIPRPARRVMAGARRLGTSMSVVSVRLFLGGLSPRALGRPVTIHAAADWRVPALIALVSRPEPSQ